MNHNQTPTPPSVKLLLENFSDQLKLISGDPETPFHRLSQPKEALPNDLIVLSEPGHIDDALKGSSKLWIVKSNLITDELKKRPLTLLSAENPKLCLALIAQKYFRPFEHHTPVGDSDIHPQASIDASAKIGKGVKVGPHAVIGKNCVVAENCIIGSGSVLENNVSIGARSHIHPLVFIGHHSSLGEECEIKPQAVIGGEGFGYATDVKNLKHHRITHFGKVILGHRVHIGSGTTIDRGTFADSKIGDDTKIDNLCHFGHNIEIGCGTIVTGGVIVAGSVKIGNACVIGGGTSISGHLEITDQVQIGGLSGVTKSITQSGAYGGYPLQPIKDYLKTQSSLPSLPELRKQVSKLVKRFQKEED